MAIDRSTLLGLTSAELQRVLDRARLDVKSIETAKPVVLAGNRGAQPAGAQRKRQGAPVPPLTNRGGKSPQADRSVRIVADDGKAVEIPARRGWDGGAAFIDYLTFTCHESSFAIRQQGVTDHEVIVEASFVCDWVLGYGVTSQRERGMFMYQRSYVLGDAYGIVCHGGQRDTVCISLTGIGCAAAKDGWEGRLYYFLSQCAQNPRITRIDLAHDDYEGTRSVDAAKEWHLAGMFASRGRPPSCEMRGDWLNPSGKGRTFYVGNSKNGKLYRAYEKGMQLGDKQSPWVRHEIEYRSVDREVPFDSLLNPAAYMAAAYPALAWISEKQKRVETTKRVVKANYEKAVEWVTKQCGGYLALFAEIEGGVEEAFKKLARPEKLPAKLMVPDWVTVGKQFHHDSELAFT